MKPRLLLVDDEERILRSLAMLFRAEYEVVATVDAQAALAEVRERRVHVVVSDQRMPVMRGAELLRRVRELSPNTMRLLLTGYSELDAIVASINEGEVFRFINKPWDAHTLRTTVRQAADIALALFDSMPARAGVSPASEGVLVLDDDPSIVAIVREIVDPDRAVHGAATIDAALSVLAQHDVGVLVSELFVRDEPIAQALKMLKAHHPEVVTIVLTPFEDTTLLAGLINQAQVFRYLPKPVRRGPLAMNITSALRHHRALREAPALRAAHVVESAPADTSGLAARVMGYLARARSRIPEPG